MFKDGDGTGHGLVKAGSVWAQKQDKRFRPSWGKVLNAILRGPGFTHRLCRAQLRKVTNQSWV